MDKKMTRFLKEWSNLFSGDWIEEGALKQLAKSHGIIWDGDEMLKQSIPESKGYRYEVRTITFGDRVLFRLALAITKEGKKEWKRKFKE